jgi:uncharacterized cofD-like protein
VVSVADDGGSSGRLRREMPVLPPGDLRKCLVALAAEQDVWTAALDYRFDTGDLEGHSLGNLLIAGLEQVTGDPNAALAAVAALLRVVGDVVPATVEAVTLRADVDGRTICGQVAIMETAGSNKRLSLEPPAPAASPAAIAAIARADQIVLAPGSLYTSLLPVICVPEIAAALHAAPGRVVQVANLLPELPETIGMTGVEHVQAVLDHGGRVEEYLYDPAATLIVDGPAIGALGVKVVGADVAQPNRRAHDPVRLARALSSLL